MKRILLSLALLVSAFASYAADYRYLIVENNDGTEATYVLSGLSISMKDGQITFTNDEVTDVATTITDVKKMFFAETSAINATFAEADGVVVYDLSGKRIGAFKTREAMEQTIGKGVYVIKSGSTTRKELLK